MKILSYHFGHDGSITYLRKGRIIFHSQLERTNKFKSHAIPSRELIEALKRHEVKPDVFVITWVDYNDWVPNIISLLKRNNIISEQTCWSRSKTYITKTLLIKASSVISSNKVRCY